MRTYGYGRVVFDYNGDLSGDVSIFVPVEDVELVYAGGEPAVYRVTVAADALVGLIANQVRSQRIAELERMDQNDLLGLKLKG